MIWRNADNMTFRSVGALFEYHILLPDQIDSTETGSGGAHGFKTRN
ncbi:hypothetical protein E2320_020157, partial [Naja naja]